MISSCQHLHDTVALHLRPHTALSNRSTRSVIKCKSNAGVYRASAVALDRGSELDTEKLYRRCYDTSRGVDQLRATSRTLTTL